MNMLLISGEIPENEVYSISGERAEHIRTVLRAKPGDSLKVGVPGGKMGRAILRTVEKNHTEITDIVLDKLPPEPLPVSLAVALPRPQSLKKVLHFAASAGIPELILFQSVRVEKSYWNSTLLKEENLNAELTEGLEQGCTTRFPKLKFYRSFREFMQSDELKNKEVCKVIAHPSQELFTPVPASEKYLLAIGPEGGFVPSETAAFEQTGFLKAAFGRHILRVEFACAFITGCLSFHS